VVKERNVLRFRDCPFEKGQDLFRVLVDEDGHPGGTVLGAEDNDSGVHIRLFDGLLGDGVQPR
jgi:hypothetical protein